MLTSGKSYHRLQSAMEALEDFIATPYSIFDGDTSQKSATIWQPDGEVEDVETFPKPLEMESKAEAFLQTAIDSGSGIATAPEWSYDINWVTDHEQLLFSADSPLFILGCAPVAVENIGSLLDQLEEVGYDCITADERATGNARRVPDPTGKSFVTPTIIPIKSAARKNTQRDTLLIQFKNKYMSAWATTSEQRRLALGEGIWQLDPHGTRTKIAVWTCSDILDKSLRDSVQKFGKKEDAIVAHVQCNPEPLHAHWSRFRAELFDTRSPTTYINANWSNISPSGSDEFGYSGVFAKADRYTNIGDGFEDTCRLGGIAGSNTRGHYEYVCSVVDDVISKYQFHRVYQPGGVTEAPTVPDIRITNVWECSGGEYTKTDGVTLPNQPDNCTEFRKRTKSNAVNEEILTALLFGDIAIPPGTFNPHEDLTWAAIGSFSTESGETFAPRLRYHAHRGVENSTSLLRPVPDDIARRSHFHLNHAASDRNIEINDQFGIDDTPVNATYKGRDVPIQLSVLEDDKQSKEQRRAEWLYEWYDATDRRFKPVVVVDGLGDEYRMKTLAGYEDATAPLKDPNRIDNPTRLEELE